MALKRKKLIAARNNAGLSQEELAEALQTTHVSISNWETGKNEPTPHFKGKIKKYFNVQEDIDDFLEVVEVPDEDTLFPRNGTPMIVEPYTVHTFIANDPARRFWSIAHTDYATLDEMITDIQAAMKDMTMTGDSLTRREALCELASIPLIAMGTQQTLKASRYEEMLKFCTMALQGCWQLYRDGDPVGTQHAFECCSTYVPLLETIAHDSSRHRKEALDLATRYALLQTMLGWSCTNSAETVIYAQNALSLSTQTGNILLQLSAYTKLGQAYLANRQPTKAWETMQEGEHVLKEYQRKKNKAPLLSGMIGSFNSSYAMVQADNGSSPDTALGIATDSEPLSGHIAFVEFTESSQWLEAARTCSAKGDPKQAMIWIGKRIDLETFAPRVPQSERGRIQAMNIITRSSLQSAKRDMGQIIKVWTASIEGAKALKSERLYIKAMVNFETMQALWSGEEAIRKLMPMTSHW